MTPSTTSTSSTAEQVPSPISFWEAFCFWLKLGFISFGGPAGQIAIMHQELVERRRWISEKRFLHALNYCMVLPGPEAQQLATYIGWLMHRSWGGIVAGGLFVLPSLFILVALSWVYIAYGDVTWVSGLFYGIKPAVTAIVVHAAHRIGSRALKNSVLWGIAAAAFVAIFALNIPFPVIVITAAVIGYVGGRKAPEYFCAGGGHGKAGKSYGAALIDDNTPSPAHALFSWARLLKIGSVGAVLWAAPMGLLVATQGWDGTLTQMAWFFTKAALLTFGGAYAVLPYVYQGAVGTYGWLTPTQMIDGLALGETTPGPLIMVVAFLPSFIFILAGGPLVESTHGEMKFTGPLTAITAAVVGVILNLALFFGCHVIWPTGFDGSLDWMSVVIALGAALALFASKRNVIHAIGVCAWLGLYL